MIIVHPLPNNQSTGVELNYIMQIEPKGGEIQKRIRHRGM